MVVAHPFGDISVTADHLAFDPKRRAEVLLRLDALAGCSRSGERREHGAPLTEFQVRSATLLGCVEVRSAKLTVRTLSVEHADKMSAIMTSALTGIVQRGLRVHGDPSKMVAMRARSSKSSSVDELGFPPKSVREDAWPDTELSILGGKTPRDAIKTKRGRQKVEGLLKDMAHYEGNGQLPPAMSTARLRTLLGI